MADFLLLYEQYTAVIGLIYVLKLTRYSQNMAYILLRYAKYVAEIWWRYGWEIAKIGKHSMVWQWILTGDK